MIGIEMHTKCTNEVLATITHFFSKFAWCYIDTYEIISCNEQMETLFLYLLFKALQKKKKITL